MWAAADHHPVAQCSQAGSRSTFTTPGPVRTASGTPRSSRLHSASRDTLEHLSQLQSGAGDGSTLDSPRGSMCQSIVSMDFSTQDAAEQHLDSIQVERDISTIYHSVVSLKPFYGAVRYVLHQVL